MLAEASGLAVLAALSPTALLIAAVYLGSERPRLTASLYLAGAVLMSVVTATVALAVLRNLGLSRPPAVTPRYVLRIGLGALLLAGGLAAAARRRRTRRPAGPSVGDLRPALPAGQQPGILARMTARPRPGSAFTVGLLVFAPGVTFVAAIQVIATARASFRLTVLALALVVVINVMLVWLPVVVYLFIPEGTGRWLSAFNSWIRANGGAILVVAMLLASMILELNGIHGLAAS